MEEVLDLERGHIHHAMRRSFTKAAYELEKYATDLCPKNTTQLSKTIGHYRVDPDTRDEAEYQYCYSEDPSAAIWIERSG